MSDANQDENWRARDPPMPGLHLVLQARGHGRHHPDCPSLRQFIPRATAPPFVPRATAPPFIPRTEVAMPDWGQSQPQPLPGNFPLPQIVTLMAPPPSPSMFSFDVFRGFSAGAPNGQGLQVIQHSSPIPQQLSPQFFPDHAQINGHGHNHNQNLDLTHMNPHYFYSPIQSPQYFPRIERWTGHPESSNSSSSPVIDERLDFDHLPLPTTKDEGIQVGPGLSRQEPRPRYQKAPTWKTADFCTFCKNIGEPEEVYSSHLLKVKQMVIQCPVLTRLVCPICQATGQDAHTRRHCPVNMAARIAGIYLAPQYGVNPTNGPDLSEGEGEDGGEDFCSNQ